MSRYTGPKCKICRREGEKLFLKGEKCETRKCPLFRRQQAPGQHGDSRRRVSEYGQQLREKQKLKRIYGVWENQFKRYFREAEKLGEDTGKALLRSLERRLDNAVYRANLAASRSQARQLIVHGKVEVNGKKVDKPSYAVFPGDEIVVESIPSNIPERETPDWITADGDAGKAKITRDPERDDIGADIDESMVVEFYSR
ncbi:MAG: 30S ribosomal protein S4 [Patescibacteria group bacterium]|nr:30S ribosomal protein S4 [Patescibacteria group bacterium]